ncbi:class I SAM-dependent methyltransferase [Euzebya sp.]|uniref:class I SAM-dependent methyltransferase n=1 Tax=Euzebya sp. TaxID=1971409 RepID=UPI003515D784
MAETRIIADRERDCGVGPGRPLTAVIGPLLDAYAPGVGVRVELWDGSVAGDPHGPVVRIRSADALRRLLWAPGELGVGRAYVAGDIDIHGDVIEAVAALRDSDPQLRVGPRHVAALLRAARQVGAIGRPLPPPPEEARPRGLRHSKARDASAISHHYDVGNEFYRLVLGPAMTYSCARFNDPSTDLAEAQASKHDLVCRKLGLHERPGVRLLDVGCGWGSMAIHAARTYGARVVGVTISREQVDAARARVIEAGVADLVEIRLQDYRDVRGERFDAISSIGMSEHVGSERIGEYFSGLAALLAPRGRLLNHAISSVGGSKLGRRSFMGRYVFPDGELLDVGDTVLAMEAAGLEVRDVESLREHYATTLRHWIANLEANWDDAVRLVGERRARVWRIYMAGSALGFEDGGLGLHQVLGVTADPDGGSGMARTRDGFVTAPADVTGEPR